ncbi:GNAT family N-acetyltransferase [Arcanobacterium sp. S3PF19]|uniref:GNAT family N-acetyltransferase n=1 Tax=Arcanobacterium sp. S3PF19 TaxID=1219585 RepID=UPI00069067D4|nr:GNAT family N-acetyltransferase [Arcanobacterium sp. S3PF19]
MVTMRVLAEPDYEAVTDLLLENFPEEERGTRDALLGDFSAGRYVGVAAWEDGAPRGALVGWRGTPETVLISWLAVDGKMRGRGVGGKLLDEAVRNWEQAYNPDLILGEIHSPSSGVSHPRYGDSEARWRFYRRHGARRIGIPYAMPVPGKNLSPVKDMWLLLFGGRAFAEPAVRAGENFGAETCARLRDFLHAYLEDSFEERDAGGHYRKDIEEMLRAAGQAKLI